MTTERADTPHQVFERYLDAITAQRWDELPTLYADDAVVEHPLGPPDHRILHGRDELRTHFTALRDMGLQMQASDVLVHDTLDPEVIIAEFTYHGTTNIRQPIRRRNIFVITVRAGHIVNSRDYQGDA